jgi:hypothetical protein
MSTLLNPNERKAALIAERKRVAQAASGAIEKAPSQKTTLIPPEDATNKIRIIFDNSGSMGDTVFCASRYEDKMTLAKRGVVEFLRNCTLNKDAVAVHLLNQPNRYSYHEEEEALALPELILKATLSTDLLLIAAVVDCDMNQATGGTPLFETIEKALSDEPKATRLVAFSDGAPAGFQREEVCYNLALRYKIPIDSVFFGSAADTGCEVMKKIAEKTGGIFILFDPAKGVNFATAFKYLTPGRRLMLMDSAFKAKLERGEVK